MTPRDLQPQDAELIAAFIDRRLPEKERQAFMERLDSDEALYEVFVETVRCRDELAGKPAEIIGHPSSRRAWGRYAAIAALLALAVATPFVIRSFSEESYAEMLVADGQLDEYLTEGWYEQPWSEMRGTQPGRSEADTAFRIGVRVVDLEVALWAKNEDAPYLVKRLQALLREVQFSEPLELSYSAVQEMIDREAPREDIVAFAKSTEVLVKAQLFEVNRSYTLGRWAETGRLAARSGNRSLLRSRRFRRVLFELVREDWPGEVSSGLARLGELLLGPLEVGELRLLEEAFSSVSREI